MSSRLIDEIVTLTKEGWRPYRGIIQDAVYHDLACPGGVFSKAETRVRPYWFSRADIFLCVGCSKRCSLNRPVGFQPTLEINYPYDPQRPFTLTPEELVASKHTLQIREAAYCLNCSEGKVYKYIYTGVLVPLKEKPYRIKATDIQRMMNDFDD